jgi:hypothetical protein
VNLTFDASARLYEDIPSPSELAVLAPVHGKKSLTVQRAKARLSRRAPFLAELPAAGVTSFRAVTTPLRERTNGAARREPQYCSRALLDRGKSTQSAFYRAPEGGRLPLRLYPRVASRELSRLVGLRNLQGCRPSRSRSAFGIRQKQNIAVERFGAPLACQSLSFENAIHSF